MRLTCAGWSIDKQTSLDLALLVERSFEVTPDISQLKAGVDALTTQIISNPRRIGPPPIP